MRSRVRLPGAAALSATAGTALIIAVLLAVAGPAGAAIHGLKYVVSKDKPVARHSQLGQKAACPHGTSVTGGGVHVDGTSTSTSVASTEPFDSGSDSNTKPDDGWKGFINNATASTFHMRTMAICSTSGKFKYIESAATFVYSGQQASAQADCPPGTQVTGGGMNISGDDTSLEVASSEPVDTDADGVPDNGWLAYANNDSGTPQPMNAFAICAVGGPALQYLQSTGMAVANGQQVGDHVSCPAGSAVTGGGVHLTGTSTSIEVASTEPWDDPADADTKPADGWLAYANNDSGTQQTMTTFAICRH